MPNGRVGSAGHVRIPGVHASWILVAVLGCERGAPEPTAPRSLGRVAGVVEGFYGPVWSDADRARLIDDAAAAGLDTWLYAPKLDPYHRDDWRTPYPQDRLDHFGEMARRGPVRFVFALAPGLDFVEGADTDVVIDKLQRVQDAGVRDFCLLFDDVFGEVDAGRPEVQVALVNAVRGALPDDSSLCFISNAYAGSPDALQTGTTAFDPLLSHGSDELYAAYPQIDPTVPVMWTGPFVFSRTIDAAEAAALRAWVGRDVWLWDNFPVNDGPLVDELFLGAVPSRPGVDDALDGVLINPSVQPHLSRIAIRTLGIRRADPDGYDPRAARDAVIADLDDGRGTLAMLADQFASHPYLDDDLESAAFQAAWHGGDDAALDALLAGFAACDPSELPDPEMAAELAEPCAKLALYGQAGQAARAGDPVGAQGLLDQARAIRWKVGANAGGLSAVLIADGHSNDQDVFEDWFAEVLPAP